MGWVSVLMLLGVAILGGALGCCWYCGWDSVPRTADDTVNAVDDAPVAPDSSIFDSFCRNTALVYEKSDEIDEKFNNFDSIESANPLESVSKSVKIRTSGSNYLYVCTKDGQNPSYQRFRVSGNRYPETYLPTRPYENGMKMFGKTHYFGTPTKNGWFQGYLRQKCSGRTLKIVPSEILGIDQVKKDVLVKGGLYANSEEKPLVVGKITDVDHGRSHFSLDDGSAAIVTVKFEGTGDIKTWNFLLRKNLNGSVADKVEISQVGDLVSLKFPIQMVRWSRVEPFHISRDITRDDFESGSVLFMDALERHQHLSLCDILVFFQTWKELQVSCALGGFWNWDGSLGAKTKHFKKLGLDSKVVRDFRDFVLSHDYDRESHKFVPRKMPIPRMTDEQTAALAGA